MCVYILTSFTDLKKEEVSTSFRTSICFLGRELSSPVREEGGGGRDREQGDLKRGKNKNESVCMYMRVCVGGDIHVQYMYMYMYCT